MGFTSISTGTGTLGSLDIHKPSTTDYVVSLAGNPNVGKSTLFNALTGLHQHTGNWSGKTVALAQGRTEWQGQGYILVDLPGTYSIVSHSPEEEVAREFICSGKAQATVVVCDATCLERSLVLALQVIGICPRTLVCVNLVDEASKNGVHIDAKLLEQKLGVPVVLTTARGRQGLESLMKRLAQVVQQPAAFGATVYATLELPTPQEAQSPAQASHMVLMAQRIAAACTQVTCNDRCQRQRRIDSVLTSRITGIPIMLGLLALILWLTISGANYPSQLLSSFFFSYDIELKYWMLGIGLPQWFTELCIDGVYRVLAWVISVMLPPMAIFFPLFTLLEDLGYLPRVAFNLDHLFQRCNACGKQCLTIAMGLGCNAAGVTGCRIIDSPRERLIAIVTNALVPCNGRFPTLVALISVFFVSGAAGGSFVAALILTALVALGLGMTFLASWVLSHTLLQGVPSSFTLELPPFRRPQAGQVIVRSVLDRTLFVLARAVWVAAPAGAVIWLMANLHLGDTTLLAHAAALLDPLGRLMGMDGVILLAFILGFPANEIVLPIAIMAYTAAGSIGELGLAALGTLLTQNGWTPLTALCVMLFSLMHWPCSTTCLTVKKETGSWYWTAVAFFIPTLCGFVVCSIVAATGRLFV